jgi:hypothetical protein
MTTSAAATAASVLAGSTRGAMPVGSRPLIVVTFRSAQVAGGHEQTQVVDAGGLVGAELLADQWQAGQTQSRADVQPDEAAGARDGAAQHEDDVLEVDLEIGGDHVGDVRGQMADQFPNVDAPCSRCPRREVAVGRDARR